MAEGLEDPVTLLIVMIGMMAPVLLVIAIYASRYQRVPPNMAMIIYGRRLEVQYTYMEDGKPRTATRAVGYRIVRGGGAFVMPIIERIGWLSLETHALDLKVTDIKTKDGAVLAAELVAQVKIRGDDASLRTASEQLLGKQDAEIKEMARSVIEARTRTTLFDMALPDINADRKAAELKLGENIDEEFKRLGLQLSVLVLKEVRVEKDIANKIVDENIKPGDLFKVVKNSRGELIVQKMTGGLEG